MFLVKSIISKPLSIFICTLCVAFFSVVQVSWANNIKLFGTAEFRSSMDKTAAWVSVLNRQSTNDFFTSGTRWRGDYAEFKKIAATKTPKEQLIMVNTYWNQYPYRLDSQIYGKEDYWAIPDQFVKNSGDSEDYAIAKYFTLRDLGYSPDDLRIVVLQDTIRNYDHAILAVYIDGDAYVLDNLTNSIFSHDRYKNYLPQFSINEKWRWMHIAPKK